MSTAPTPTPPKGGAWLWWILGFAGVAVVLLIMSGLLIAGFFLKGLRVSPREQRVEVRTPVGELAVSKTPAGEVGLPVYPGATLVESGKSVELSLPEDQAVGIAAVHYRSSDSLEKVDAWYHARLGPEFKRDTGDTEGKIRAHGVSAEGVAYVAEDHDLVRLVVLTKRGSRVEIGLLRIGERERQ